MVGIFTLENHHNGVMSKIGLCFLKRELHPSYQVSIVYRGLLRSRLGDLVSDERQESIGHKITVSV